MKVSELASILNHTQFAHDKEIVLNIRDQFGESWDCNIHHVGELNGIVRIFDGEFINKDK
jgi:hypothetical protein